MIESRRWEWYFRCIQISGNRRPKGKTSENKLRSIICTYVAGRTFELSEIGISAARFSICRYLSRDKETGACSRLAESIKESITAENRGTERRKRKIHGAGGGDASAGSAAEYLGIFQLSQLLQYSVSLSARWYRGCQKRGGSPSPFRFRWERLVVFLRFYW